MTADEIINFCLLQNGAYIDYPFGELPVCIRVRGRIFAQLYTKSEDFKITLKCEPVTGDFYKNRYPGTVVRGYFCPPVQQPYWITVQLNGIVSDEELKIMISQAYKAAIAKLPKKVREELKESPVQSE